jgi:pimeloyl-ACP methyl ester carboxylesterase
MAETTPTMAHEEVGPQRKRRRWPWIVAVSVFALVVLFHVVGGFYFAAQIRSDGFEPSGPESSVDATAGPVSGGTITLFPVDDSAEPHNEGVYGLKYEDGYGQIGKIESDTDSEVVREFELLEGTPPSEGTDLDVMSWAYPSDPFRAFGYEYETVQYDTELGPMDAWIVPASGDTWAIFVHGKGVDRREGLRILPTLHDADMPVILVNYRNDDGEPPDPSGIYQYGQTEWRDLEDAVGYATENGAERIVLVGASTGGAIISAFLLESELAADVEAVLFDAPNLDFEQAVDLAASDRTLPLIGLPIPPTLTWTAKNIAARQLDVSWDALDYISRADEFTAPILLFHGTEDGTVPVEVARRMEAARPDLVDYVETSAGHVQSWNVEPPTYHDHVVRFLAD